MKIIIPQQLQKVVGKPEIIYYIEGAEKGMDIKNILSLMFNDFPVLKDRMLDKEGKINKFINVFVNDEDIRFLNGGKTRLKEEDIVSIIPAIAGG